uniref:Guanine deaminase n=1 Tax=Mastacembelus armatus TaxID=205130 RepID=A0A3Q3M2A9_9TELE
CCALNRPRAKIAHVYRGTFMHSTQDTTLEIIEDALLGVDTVGKVSHLLHSPKKKKKKNVNDFHALLRCSEFFMPGMVDTHIHAPQYSYTGTAMDLPLLQWLNTYTFPVESRFKDLKFAHRVYTEVVKRTLKNGTTTACYFATIHTDASLLLGKIANDFGQRAFVGKVCMDRNKSDYKETTQECQKETCRFIAELLNKKYPLVKPVVTPRFAPSCTGDLLGQLGAIARKNNLHIQSHISENVDEVKLVKELFPESKSYTDVYHKYNLLTDKTVMAHGCHLTDEELTLFSETGASLSHCPNSNISLCSGLLNVRNVLKHKVKLGLGTDVAGGYSASMLDAVRRTLDTSKVLTIQNPKHQALTFDEVFRLATLGGSQALFLDDQTGNFEVGKDFDALRVNVAPPGGPIDLILCDKPKVGSGALYKGDDRNIVEVFVAGRKVVPFMEPAAE